MDTKRRIGLKPLKIKPWWNNLQVVECRTIASELISVQPMSMPDPTYFQHFYLDYVYGTNSQTNENETTTRTETD